MGLLDDKKIKSGSYEKEKVTIVDCYSLMEKETHYAKAKWAEKLGVSASGYYNWRQEREERQRAQTALEDRVIALFEEGEENVRGGSDMRHSQA